MVNIGNGGYYDITLSHAVVEKGAWTITVYNGDRNKLTEFESIFSQRNASCRFVYLSQGTNYILVEKKSYGNLSNTDYTLSVIPSAIPQMSISKLTKPKKKQIKVSWQKASNITGYEITLATNKKFTKGINRVYVGTGKKNYTFKKLKRKKTYYVRIRGYVYENNKYYYGNYSPIKRIKTK